MNIEKLTKLWSNLPSNQRLIIALLFPVFIGVIFYYMFYQDLSRQQKKIQSTLTRLEADKKNYEERKKQYNAFREQVVQLTKENEKLKKILPTSTQVPRLLQTLHAQAELSGLNIITFDQGNEVRHGFYAEIPVRMKITGKYHQIGRFFNEVRSLQRIVNIHDMKLELDKARNAQNRMLDAHFTASTFRFLEEDEKAQDGKEKNKRNRSRKKRSAG